jgi:hypothetical protein
MFNVFKITNAGSQQPVGNDLLGLLIVKVDEEYFLVDPKYMLENPIIMPAAVLDSRDPKLRSFNFELEKLKWTLNFSTDQPDPTKISGTWSPDIDHAVEDNFTATSSGGGAGVPEDNEARAASAK